MKELIPLLNTLVGGFIGFSASFAIWWLTQRRQRREKRRETFVRLSRLAFEALDFTRKLAYAKAEGVQAVRQIGHDPVAEIMAITQLQCVEVGSVTQQLHDKMQELFALPMSIDAGPQVMALCEEINKLANTFNTRLLELATRERLDEGPDRGKLVKYQSNRRISQHGLN